MSRSELDAFKAQVEQASDEELYQMLQIDEETYAHEYVMPADMKKKILSDLKKRIIFKKVFSFSRYAAILLVLVAVTSIVSIGFSTDAHKNKMVTVIVEPGNKSKLSLPDGSQVILNSETKILYDVSPTGNRDVTICYGEAYFDVAKDKQHPFHVNIGDSRIEVLGTTFNTKTTEDNIETSLYSGSILFSSKALDHDVRLIPGKKIAYDLHTHETTITDNDYLDSRWKDGYLVFKSKKLVDVFREIEKWYGVKVIYKKHKNGDDLLTGSFNNESLENVLDALCMQYGFAYYIKGNTIIIK